MELKSVTHTMLAMYGMTLLVVCGMAEETTEYSITLDPEDRYNVTWSSTGHQPDDVITFTVRFKDNA